MECLPKHHYQPTYCLMIDSIYSWRPGFIQFIIRYALEEAEGWRLLVGVGEGPMCALLTQDYIPNLKYQMATSTEKW